MAQVWSVDRVISAAPDGQVEVAGRKLATPAPWSGTGYADPLLWGRCRGSSKTPYEVAIDVSEPSYKCSCPSRKFPCKHSIGLLFLWAQGQLQADGEISDFANQWQQRRAGLSGGDAGQPEKPPLTAEQAAEAAERRNTARLATIAAGAAELDRWITDQVDRGFAQLPTGRGHFEPMAARMVDAKAPGLASRLRRLEGIQSTGAGWPDRLLAELSMIRLLARAAAGIDQLEAENPSLAANVRAHLGVSTPAAEVRTRPPVRDRWLVFGLHDVADDERVNTRRVWLHGLDTGRPALVLLFAVNGAAFDNTTLVPGIVLDADLHFHPGSPPLRALLGTEHAEPVDVGRPGHGMDLTRVSPLTVAEAAAAHAGALAEDPWLDLVPAILQGRLHRNGTGWALVGDDGSAVRISTSHRAMLRAMATTAGRPATILGEWGLDGFNPLSVLGLPAEDGRGVDDRLVVL